jgi:perosamine synthetase
VKFTSSEPKELLHQPRLGSYDPKEEARHLFKFMKAPKNSEALWTRAVPFQDHSFEDYHLVPISRMHLNNPLIISKLIEFRNSNIKLWPGAKLVDENSTLTWLEELVLKNDDRILFLVQDSHQVIHGHIGIWLRDNTIFEIDNVIKDYKCNIKGLFSEALRTLCKWANEFIGESEFYLRVLNTNEHAIKFYERNRFIVHAQQQINGDQLNDVDSQVNWVVMKLSIDEYFEVPKDILTAGPSIGPFEISLVTDAVRNGWNTKHSDYIHLFSNIFSEYVGAKFAIPTDSCTSALHLSLWAIGIGPGDEVIVPEVTWVATASVVKMLGAKPIFADIDPDTWTIDIKSVENLINEKTKAIIPVHLYGFVADLAPLENLCNKYNLKLIQDAAPGIGSMFKSQGIATKGDFTCFSFQGAKLLVTGEGGMLTTNNEELFNKAFKISDSGRRPGTFWIETLGKKMKMNNITAALGVAQMQGVERQIAKKRLINDWYHQEFSNLPNVKMQKELMDTRSICWMSSLYFSNPQFNREELQTRLKIKGIDTRPVFSPISQYPIWGETLIPKATAKMIGDNSLNLPSGVNLSQASISKISNEIKQYVLELERI